MKRIQNYSLKIAILLIVIGSMAFLYWYGFHKQFDEKSIPKNADGIVIVDIKNTRNHFIFSCLKNPSQWGFCRKNSKTKKRFDFSNYGLQTPDYLSFFHIENQPLTQWCLVAKIENETKFAKALTDSHFVKTKLENSFIGYYSKTNQAYIILYANTILYCTNASKDQKNYIQIAEDLFIKNSYFDSKKIENPIESSNAVTIWIKKNNLLNENAIINVLLKENEISAEGQINLKSKFRKTASFIQNSNALLSLGFNFDLIRDQDLIKLNQAKISKMIGFELDTILIHHPTQTELIFNNIIEKKDSAITYDYDDDFNPIKKIVVHSTREPSFYFSMQTDNSAKTYDYLKKQNAIDDHQIFVNFPLAKTKTFVKNNSLIFEANLPKNQSSKSTKSKIGYIQINFAKIQPKDWRFIIVKNKNFEFLKAFGTFEINLTQQNNSVFFQANLKAKNGKNWTEVIN